MRIWAASEKLDRLREAEAIIFDCDGTLIDAAESYDLAIKLTACIILRELVGIPVSLGPDVDECIEALRMTGGFNNDWNSAAALSEAVFVFSDRPILKEELERIDAVAFTAFVKSSLTEPEEAREAVKWLTREIHSHSGSLSFEDVERFIERKAVERMSLREFREFKKILGFPGEFGVSILSTLFDEIFLGEDGVRAKYGIEPRYVSWEGTLINEKLLIYEENLEKLSSSFILGILTGRGKWETEKTLGSLLRYFRPEASIYTADMGEEYEKPSPKALIEVAETLKIENLIYVGNSAEDLLTAKAAREIGLRASFIGVTDSPKMREYFIKNDADAVIEDVNLLSSLLFSSS